MEPLTAEKRALVEMSAESAGRIAMKYARMHPGHEDELESSAYMGLIEAANSFVPGNGIWERYARRYVKLACVHTMSKMRKDDTVSLCDLDFDLDCYGYDGQPRDSFDDLVRSLRPQQQEFLRAVYIEGKSIREASRQIGYHAYYGYHIHETLVSKLRVQLGV